MDFDTAIFLLVVLAIAALSVLVLYMTRRRRRALGPNEFASPLFAQLELSDDEFASRKRKGFTVGLTSKMLSFGAAATAATGFALALPSDTETSFVFASLPWLVVAAALGTWSRKEGRKHKLAEQAALDERGGPYVLYFRPFTFDLTTKVQVDTYRSGLFSKKSVAVALEEALGQVCLEAGLGFRSIGKVDDQLGPTAVVSSDEDWQAHAGQMMQNAKLIILVPGSSPGSAWEINEIASRSFLNKTVWIMPSEDILNISGAAASWHAMISPLQAATSLPFPQFLTGGALFAFGQDGQGAQRVHVIPFSFEHLVRIVSDVR